MYNPKVSIIIPAYNASNYLAEAIDSALAQTYKNIEIIVVNDGSKDDGKTAKVAELYKDKIIYIEKENGGSSSALNCGIRAMTGEWFSWLSHDDLYFPQKIELQVQIVDSCVDKNAVMLCAFQLIDGDGKLILDKKGLGNKFVNAEQMFKRFAVKRKTINGCSVLMNKSVIDNVGFFDENLRYLNDMDYWYRIMLCGYNFQMMPTVLVKNRIHGEQVTVKRKELLDIEKVVLVNKIFNNIIENNKGIFYLKNLLLFCSYENINTVVINIKKYLVDKGLPCFRFYVFCYKIKGKIARFLKRIRQKILFKR